MPTSARPPVLCACVDIGSNTTRLLVAEGAAEGLREVMQQRAFTRLGKGLRKDASIAPEKLAETVEGVTRQVKTARAVGAERICVVATAAIRQAGNGPELCEAVRERSGIEVWVLTGEEEARLAFVGATRTLRRPVEGEVGVVDVGGGSTELALGTVAEGVRWSASFRVGSGFLTDAYLRSDPPAIGELHDVRRHVQGVFEGLDLAHPSLAVAVGGSATSLRRLVGAELEPDTLERGLRVLASHTISDVARRFDLDPERVRLLPAGMLLLEAASELFGGPLCVGRGGLREGVIMDMLAGTVAA